jgi:hypothetical protein
VWKGCWRETGKGCGDGDRDALGREERAEGVEKGKEREVQNKQQAEEEREEDAEGETHENHRATPSKINHSSHTASFAFWTLSDCSAGCGSNDPPSTAVIASFSAVRKKSSERRSGSGRIRGVEIC